MPRTIRPRRRTKAKRRKNLLMNCKTPMYKVQRSLRQHVYNFVRMGEGSTFAAANLVEITQAFHFKLSDLDGYTDLTSLFDTYRIMQVQMIFKPVTIQQVVAEYDSTTGADGRIPNIWYAIDYDDAAAPGATSLKQYNGVRMKSFTQPFTVTLCPRVAVAIYNDGITTGYSTPAGQRWIDAAYQNAQHFGLKVASGATGGSATKVFQYQIDYKYWVQCKATK